MNLEHVPATLPKNVLSDIFLFKLLMAHQGYWVMNIYEVHL